MIQDAPYEVIDQVPFTAYKGPGDSRLLLVQTPTEWKTFFKLLMQQPLVFCDTETTGFEWHKDKHIVGMSFGWGPNFNFYIPVRHVGSLTGGLVPEQLDMADIIDDLKLFFAQPEVTCVWHNFKFDKAFYRKEGIVFGCKNEDTRILWQFFDENAPGALKIISSGYRDIMGIWHNGLVGKGANDLEKAVDKWRTDEALARRKLYSGLLIAKTDELQKEMEFQGWKRVDVKRHVAEQVLHDHPYREAKKEDVHYGCVPLSMMAQYAALDVYLTWVVYQHVNQYVKSRPKLVELYANELALADVLLEMERNGIVIRKEFLEGLRGVFQGKITTLTEAIKERLGNPELNLNSTKQLADALLAQGVPLEKTTESSTEENIKYALDKEVLAGLANDHDICKSILELRELTKLLGTYVDGVLDKIQLEGKDWVIHPSYNQNVSTGRMSMSNPSCMNIPGKTENGQLIRQAFGVPEDYIFLSADYSQIELRILAHLSQDELLLDAYFKGQDIHTRTMCEMFGYDYDVVNPILEKEDKTHPLYKEWKRLRNTAKIINFGIVYGVSHEGLSKQITRPDKYVWTKDCGISKEEMTKRWVDQCKEYITQYNYRYLGVKRFINKNARIVLREGEITNLRGRIRHLPWYNASRTLGQEFRWLEGRAARQGVNYLVQGEAADLFKTATVRVAKVLEGRLSRINNVIHDDIVMYIHRTELFLLPEIKDAMEDFPEYSVPILASFEFSPICWGLKKKVG